MRLAKFTQELIRPMFVPEGAIRWVPEELLSELQQGGGPVFDVTPKATSPWTGPHRLPRPEAAIYQVGCTTCANVQGAMYTLCPDCHNSRRMWTANVLHPPAVALERQRFRAALIAEAHQYYTTKKTAKGG